MEIVIFNNYHQNRIRIRRQDNKNLFVQSKERSNKFTKKKNRKYERVTKIAIKKRIIAGTEMKHRIGEQWNLDREMEKKKKNKEILTTRGKGLSLESRIQI